MSRKCKNPCKCDKCLGIIRVNLEKLEYRPINLDVNQEVARNILDFLNNNDKKK